MGSGYFLRGVSSRSYLQPSSVTSLFFNLNADHCKPRLSKGRSVLQKFFLQYGGFQTRNRALGAWRFIVTCIGKHVYKA